MNTILWILQALMALVFFVPGIVKLLYPEEKLVAKGMMGDEGMRLPLIRFIGISEVLGAIGIVLPMLLNILPVLTIVSAIGLAVIMILATITSYKKGEYKKMVFTVTLFLICLFIAYGRIAFAN